MTILIHDIAHLVQTDRGDARFIAGKDMANLPVIANAYLVIKDGQIDSYGKMSEMTDVSADTVIDGRGRVVMPAFCDSHTHLVYAGSREGEFVDKINGLSYVEIAQRGGGILNSAERLHHTSEDELFLQASARIEEIMNRGTGAVEIKSGYGLTVEDELKMLRVIARLKSAYPIAIRSTLLGAHAFPAQYKGREDEYVDLIINEMLPRAAAEGLVDYIDSFCDKGFFTVEQTARMLEAASKYGIRGKIHANELAASGGIQIGVKYNALSVDHLEFTGDAEIAALKDSATMPTLLPGAAFFLEMEYPPARRMMESGLPVALASDYNPGSSPSGDMKFILSLACIKMKMTPEETINAATLNSAYAMGLEASHGSIDRGKCGSVIVSRPVSSVAYLPYAYTADLVERVIINGEIVK